MFAAASFIAVMGDQLVILALPWFILSISEQPWVMGLGIGLIGIPRALAILLGGVFTDRYNPLRVLIISRFLSALIILAIAILLMSHSLSLISFVLIVGLFSITNALSFPASPTMLTQLVDQQMYQKANAILMGMAQVGGLLGPTVAGFLLLDANCNDCDNQSSFFRIFFIASCCLVFSGLIVCLLPVSVELRDTTVKSGNFKTQFVNGAKYVKTAGNLLNIFIYLLVVNFVIQGCVMVGIPMLVEQSEDGSPFDHGIMISFLGSGVLFAFVISNLIPQISEERFILTVAILNAVIGGSILLLFYIPVGNFFYFLLFFTGVLNGICQLGTIRYLQTNVANAYMGRMMSYLMFCIFGLIPISASITGLLVSIFNTKTTFTILASILLVTSISFVRKAEKWV